jgi:pimeloyl-ACP methyl ester carboxylesterase
MQTSTRGGARRWCGVWLGLAFSLWVWPVVAQADLAWSACWLPGVERAARCGVLTRPLDPAAPQGRAVTLHLAMLPARSRRPAADPVVFFAGGPGQSAIDLAGPLHTWLAPVLAQRDVLLIDQRGTGRSAPLRCEEDDPTLRTLAAQLQPPSNAMAQRCLARLQALPHGDVRQYTTSIAMADVEVVRAALGVERWNLIGVSYGSRAALEFLRQQPQRVRRVVLDGVVPPDVNVPLSAAQASQRALEGMFAGCEADAACARQYPQLRRQWHQLQTGLPREVTVPHPVSGQPERFTLTHEVLAALVHAPLYAPFLAAGLPLAIDAAAAGRFTPLVGLAAALGQAQSRLASGMHFSVLCSEDGPALWQAPAASGAQALVAPYRDICRRWPRGPVPEAFYRVGPAPVATLLMSGEWDPVTPPSQAQRLQTQLGTRAQSLVMPGQGHGQLSQGCVGELVARFLDAPNDEAAQAVVQQGAPRCTRARPRPLAVLPLEPASGGSR